MKYLILLTIVACAAPAALAEDEDALMARARRLLAEVPLVDGHNDTPWQYRKRVRNHLDELDFASDTTVLEPPMHTDLARLRAGGVGAQFWSVFIPIRRFGGDGRGLKVEGFI